MIRVLVDTNIVLDVLLRRTPWLQDSVRVWGACGTGLAEGFLAAHSITTVHYMIRGRQTHDETMASMELVLRAFRVATVDEAAIHAALRTRARDFEDEVSAAAAAASSCTHIVTRDPRGFRNSSVSAVSPEKFLGMIQQI